MFLGFLTCDFRAATLYNINAASMTTFNQDIPQKAEKVWENRCMYYKCPQMVQKRNQHQNTSSCWWIKNHDDNLSASGGPTVSLPCVRVGCSLAGEANCDDRTSHLPHLSTLYCHLTVIIGKFCSRQSFFSIKLKILHGVWFLHS